MSPSNTGSDAAGPQGEELQFFLQVAYGRRFNLFPIQEPIPPGTIGENSDVTFCLEGGIPDVFRVDLTVDDRILPRVALSRQSVRWTWDVGFNAGLAEVRLTGCSPGPVVFELVTDPDRAKLTRDEFNQMVGDILKDTLALVALSGHRMEIGKGDRPLEFARFELLRSCFRRMEQSVLEINKAPWQYLEREARSVLLASSGGATAIEIARASLDAETIPTGAMASLPAGARSLAVRLGGRLPQRVRKETGRLANRREHADMLAILRVWRAFLARTRERLNGEVAGGQTAASTNRALIMQHQCGVMIQHLLQLEALPLFDGMAPTLGPITPSQLFFRSAPYRRFYSAYRDFQAGLADVEGDFLKLPLRRTFELYELWCFLRLARAAALESEPDDSWREAFGQRADSTGLVVSIETRPFRFRSFAFVFKPRYREVWRSGAPEVGSFSREMIPDMALESGELPAGLPCPVVGVDAKYRVEQGIDDAVTSIHMYRDALVHAGGGSNGSDRRTVEAAFVITPRQPDSSHAAAWRAEQAPAVFFREEYRSRFRFGAIVLRPGVSIEGCRAVLADLVGVLSQAEQ